MPSSVIMTAVTARAAGCKNVIACSPRPFPITLAAGYISGVDMFVCVGGGQAIAAMAYGVEVRELVVCWSIALFLFSFLSYQ